MENGLEVKYNVYKVDNGAVVNNCFVLRPEKDEAAVEALRAYADCTKNKALAENILDWIEDLEEGYASGDLPR